MKFKPQLYSRSSNPSFIRVVQPPVLFVWFKPRFYSCGSSPDSIRVVQAPIPFVWFKPQFYSCSSKPQFYSCGSNQVLFVWFKPQFYSCGSNSNYIRVVAICGVCCIAVHYNRTHTDQEAYLGAYFEADLLPLGFPRTGLDRSRL
jgi:hypothetical protein